MFDRERFVSARSLFQGKQRWDINGDGTSSHGKAVRSAVLEFSNSVGRQVTVAYEDLWPSWYFRK